MNRCAMQQTSFAAYEEMRTAFAAAERKPPVFCPKPRRVSPPAGVAAPIWPRRWHSSRQADFSDSNAVADLLDVLLAKVRFFVVVVTTCVFDVADTGENRSGKLVLSTSVIMICSQDGEEQNHEASSPPFFCGSPPDRAANPVVHDARFGEDRPPLAPFALCNRPSPSRRCPPSTPSSGSSRRPCGSRVLIASIAAAAASLLWPERPHAPPIFLLEGGERKSKRKGELTSTNQRN
ncbi:hypothetical protein MUK42_30149 [Musa troglodytarum]|uniref:Uncharacterized protein n=1 Tax=Musa troglodytarum TaxID=320322 RepID=A0A9E7HSZ3_9LILI|nr:hypothetical protein MUK42_30149 [Musa troglodytarum]URE39001.1 hypothetical protein MUK42_30149 [Musa troglodytarum]